MFGKNSFFYDIDGLFVIYIDDLVIVCLLV